MEEQQLTIQQAMEQGYTHCCQEEWDHITLLTDLRDTDFENNTRWWLCEKEPFKFKVPVQKVKDALLKMMENYMDGEQ